MNSCSKSLITWKILHLKHFVTIPEFLSDFTIICQLQVNHKSYYIISIILQSLTCQSQTFFPGQQFQKDCDVNNQIVCKNEKKSVRLSKEGTTKANIGFVMNRIVMRLT